MNKNSGINEILFMETRLFRQFIERYGESPKKANEIWKKFGIWDYIEDCYGTLHENGDEYILNDISEILKAKGAIL